LHCPYTLAKLPSRAFFPAAHSKAFLRSDGRLRLSFGNWLQKYQRDIDNVQQKYGFYVNSTPTPRWHPQNTLP
jgi:hypothetical protein